MRHRLRAVLLAAVTTPLLAVTASGSPAVAAPDPEIAAQVAPMPTSEVWRADVGEAMSGSLTALRTRVRQERLAGGDVGSLAVNLDIDNTSLATYYDRRHPVRAVLRFTRVADRLGVRVFFNTGRTRALRAKTVRELRRAGFESDGLCHRRPAELVTDSKPRCRARFREQGFTLVANLGNNATDFAPGADGVDFERAYRLPDYGRRLS